MPDPSPALPAAIVALGPSGAALGRRVCGLLPGAELHGPRAAPGDWDQTYDRLVPQYLDADGQLGAVRDSDLDQRNGSAPSLGACPERPHTRSSVGVSDRRPGEGDQPFRLDLNPAQPLVLRYHALLATGIA